MRAGVRIKRHTLSLPVTCRLAPCSPVPFPLFLRISSIKDSLFLHFLVLFIHHWNIFRIFVPAIRKECKTYCSIDSQSPLEKKRAKLSILGLPHLGADFPYLKVVCGEPCDVWRMSAPLVYVEPKYGRV